MSIASCRSRCAGKSLTKFRNETDGLDWFGEPAGADHRARIECVGIDRVPPIRRPPHASAKAPRLCRSTSKLLDSDGVEFQALVEELVVRESWFFRHAHAFELLRRHAASTMVARQKPYRVLSFPCAGGEEPYSIVMTLRDAGLGFHQFQVDAADISETAIQKARGGKYGMRSVRVVAPAIQGRYFRIADQSVEVLPEIRQAVRFIRANIIDTQSVIPGDKYDAVFCRNLLIYLTSAARQRVLQAVAGWLSPSGLFFVGHAEMLREFGETFRTGSGTWCIRVLSRLGNAGHTIRTTLAVAGTLALRCTRIGACISADCPTNEQQRLRQTALKFQQRV